MKKHSKEILDKHFPQRQRTRTNIKAKLVIAKQHYNNLVTMFNNTCEIFGGNSEEAHDILDIIEKQAEKVKKLTMYKDF